MGEKATFELDEVNQGTGNVKIIYKNTRKKKETSPNGCTSILLTGIMGIKDNVKFITPSDGE